MGSAEVLRCGEDDWDGLRASIITAMEREQRGQHVKEELDVSDTDTDINEPGEVVEIPDLVERVWTESEYRQLRNRCSGSNGSTMGDDLKETKMLACSTCAHRDNFSCCRAT